MPIRKKLAIILPRFPYPLDKGDKLRAYHQIVHLSKTHAIHLYSLTEEPVTAAHRDQLTPYCHSITIYPLRRIEILLQTLLSVVKKVPIQVGYFYSPRIHRQLSASIGQLQPDAVYCQLSRTALYGKDLPFRKVIDFQDAFSTNYERIQTNSGGLKALFYRYEAKRMRSFECSIAEWFDASTIISAFDKASLPFQPNQVVVVSNGVNTEHFAPKKMDKKADVLFSGNLSYLPNRQAVEYLAEQISPILIQQMPSICIRIVGASGHSFLHYQSANIQVQDWVDDIRNEYAQTKLFVAPLFSGAGLQNKLLEAMSMEIPCITTSVANASLKANHGEHLMIADDASAFAKHILHLLQQPDEARNLAINGRSFVTARYNWAAETDKLAALF